MLFCLWVFHQEQLCRLLCFRQLLNLLPLNGTNLCRLLGQLFRDSLCVKSGQILIRRVSEFGTLINFVQLNHFVSIDENVLWSFLSFLVFLTFTWTNLSQDITCTGVGVCHKFLDPIVILIMNQNDHLEVALVRDFDCLLNQILRPSALSIPQLMGVNNLVHSFHSLLSAIVLIFILERPLHGIFRY